MTNKIKPISQPEMTETKIGYSIKIGRQVLKQRLKKEIKDIERKLIDVNMDLKIDNKTGQTIYNEMQQRIELFIDNDETFHSIKLLYNIVNETKITDVKELIAEKLSEIYKIKKLISPDQYTQHADYKKQLDSQVIKLCVPFYIGTYDKDYDEYSSSTYCFEIDTTSTLLTLMSKHEKTLSVIGKYNKDLSKLNSKLKNLDETMEEMEAKLLVQELNKTKDGNDVLAITETIISETLNSHIALI